MLRWTTLLVAALSCACSPSSEVPTSSETLASALLPPTALPRRVSTALVVTSVNQPLDPAMVAGARIALLTGPRSVRSYVLEQTAGMLQLVGRREATGDVFAYRVDGPPVEPECQQPDHFQEARQRALAEGIDLSTYEQVFVVRTTAFNCPISGGVDLWSRCAPGGCPDDFNADSSSLAFLLPKFGIGHVNTMALTCTRNGAAVPFSETCTTPRADPFDLSRFQLFEFPKPWRPLSAANRMRTGTLAAKYVTASGTYPLVPLESTVDGTKLLKIYGGQVGPNPAYYYLEVRSQSGAFGLPAGSAALTGVTVRAGLGTGDGLDGLALLDMHPATATHDDAPMRSGESYTDPVTGTVFAVTMTATGADVRVSLPNTQPLLPPGNGTGLRGRYYTSLARTALVMERVDPKIDFAGRTRLHPNLGTTFAATWVGQLVPRVSEPHLLLVRSASTVRVKLDGVTVIDNLTEHQPTNDRATVDLTAGKPVAIEIEYGSFNAATPIIYLGWASRSLPFEAIPATQLIPGPAIGGPPAGVAEQVPVVEVPVPVPVPAAPSPVDAGFNEGPGGRTQAPIAKPEEPAPSSVGGCSASGGGLLGALAVAVLLRRRGGLLALILALGAIPAVAQPAAKKWKMAVVLFNTPTATNSYTAAMARAGFESNPRSVKKFVAEVSYGAWALEGKNGVALEVLGPYTWTPANNDPCTAALGIGNPLRDVATAAGANLDGYDLLGFSIPNRPCYAFGVHTWTTPETRALTCEADYCPGGARELPQNTLSNVAKLISESTTPNQFASAQQLRCEGPDGTPVTLSHRCGRGARDPFDLHFETGLVSLSGVGRAALGALPEKNIREVFLPGVYDLESVELPGNGVKVLRVPLMSARDPRFLFLEHRAPAQLWSLPEGSEAFSGVTARMGLLSGRDRDLTLLDGNPLTATFLDAPLRAGQSFAEPMTGIEISVESVSATGARVKVTLPNAQTPIAAGKGDGLTGNYYRRDQFDTPLLTRVDPMIDFTWGEGSPSPQVPNDNFSVRWSGYLVPRVTGLHEISTIADDGIRVKVGGVTVNDAYFDKSASRVAGQVQLVAGKVYKIEIDYYEAGVTAEVALYWQALGQPLEKVPQSQLYTVAPAEVREVPVPVPVPAPEQPRPQGGGGGVVAAPSAQEPPTGGGCSSAPGALGLAIIAALAATRSRRPGRPTRRRGPVHLHLLLMAVVASTVSSACAQLSPSELELPALLPFEPQSEPPPESSARPWVDPRLGEALAATGSARVIVMLRHSEDDLLDASTAVLSVPDGKGRGHTAAVWPWRGRVVRELKRLPPGGLTVLREYQVLPFVAGLVTREGVAALERSPGVEAIELDTELHIADVQSDARMRIPEARTRFNIAGRNVRVMVVDTGIDRNHPDFAGAVVNERCVLVAGGCPGSGINQSDLATDGNGHGTVVSGIIAGRGAVAPRGLASEAGLVVFKALSDNGAGAAIDTLVAFDHVLANPQLNVRVINLSMADGANFAGDCDAARPSERFAIQRLLAAGVLVFAASGNNGSFTGVSFPGCLSGVVTVGSIARNGSLCLGRETPISCFSNSGPPLDLLVPGDPILSTQRGGGTVEPFGTSLATAGGSGVAAMLFSQNPRMWPEEVRAIMIRTGQAINDLRNNLVRPAVDALAAANEVALTSCAGRPDGAVCNDLNGCTAVDRCQAGQCVGASPRVCPAGSDPCRQPLCSPRDGQCGFGPGPDGPICDDGNRCTSNDSCQKGFCVGARKSCPGGTACEEAATCDAATGECKAIPRLDGTVCSDGDGCTRSDRCKAGVCVGGEPLVCSGGQTCRAGVCAAPGPIEEDPAPGPSAPPAGGGDSTPAPAPRVPPDAGVDSTPIPPAGRLVGPPSEVVATCQAAPGGELFALLLAVASLRRRPLRGIAA